MVESDALVRRVQGDPGFQDLVRRRSRLAWTLTALMVAIYFGFILTIAYAPGFLAQPIGGGVTTIGIPVGLGVIISAFVLTGFYVWRANSKFDDETKALLDRLGR